MKSLVVVLLLCPLCSAETCVDNGVPCASEPDTTSLLQVKSSLEPGDSRAGASNMKQAGRACIPSICYDKKKLREDGWDKTQGGMCANQQCVECPECHRRVGYGKEEDEANARNQAAGHAQHVANNLRHEAAQYRVGDDAMVKRDGVWIRGKIKETFSDGLSISYKDDTGKRKVKEIGDENIKIVCPYYHNGDTVNVKSSDGKKWSKAKVKSTSSTVKKGLNIEYTDGHGKKLVPWDQVTAVVQSSKVASHQSGFSSAPLLRLM